MTLTALLTERVLLWKLAGPRTSMQPAHCNLCLDQHIPTACNLPIVTSVWINIFPPSTAQQLHPPRSSPRDVGDIAGKAGRLKLQPAMRLHHGPGICHTAQGFGLGNARRGVLAVFRWMDILIYLRKAYSWPLEFLMAIKRHGSLSFCQPPTSRFPLRS